MRIKKFNLVKKAKQDLAEKHKRLIKKSQTLEELKSALEVMLNDTAPMLVRSTKGGKHG